MAAVTLPTLVGAGATPDAATPSGEHQRMTPAWQLISHVLAGPAAIRAASETYLPKYEEESRSEYERRLQSAPWRPEFADALRALASKPFGREVALKGDKVPEPVKAVAEDIDLRGNNLTVFARRAFSAGIAKGLHAIFVDHPPMPPNATRAAERAAGARPYWVHVEANDILALFTTVRNGREEIEHVRIRERSRTRDGFGETEVERVRIMEPGRWEIWERNSQGAMVKDSDGAIARGPNRLTSVPLVLFFTGEREGDLFVRPPLEALAHLQIELYQALSRQEEILTFAGSPMLAANGLGPPDKGEPIVLGPKRVLFAPPTADGVQTGWSFVQPAAANIAEIRNHVQSIVSDMQRLGMQPLTPQSGEITATGQSIDAAKAHSAVQAWALLLKDALEQAFRFTTEWLGEKETVEVDVSTDFSVMPFAQAPLDALDKARARGDLSRRTYWDGLRRFDVLDAGFDPDAEDKAIAGEAVEQPPAVPPTPAEPPLAA